MLLVRSLKSVATTLAGFSLTLKATSRYTGIATHTPNELCTTNRRFLTTEKEREDVLHAAASPARSVGQPSRIARSHARARVNRTVARGRKAQTRARCESVTVRARRKEGDASPSTIA